MWEMERTTIAIDQSTKEELDKYGRKGDTHDDIICRLLAENDHMKFITGE